MGNYGGGDQQRANITKSIKGALPARSTNPSWATPSWRSMHLRPSTPQWFVAGLIGCAAFASELQPSNGMQVQRFL